MPAEWVFRSYVSARGDHVLQRWYDGLDLRAQAKFDTRLKYLSQQPLAGWTRPYFDKLPGKYAELGKIRLEVRNVQLRPLGFISQRGVFTFVYPQATERDRKWHPPDARDVAMTRMQDIKCGRARTDDYEIE